MSYYCRENDTIIKKEGIDPASQHLHSYYRYGDSNVYHYKLTREEKEYLANQSKLEAEYLRNNKNIKE